MKDFRKYFAEFIGTFVLVVFGCGVAAVLGCATPAGYVGTALAFGLVIVAMAYSIGKFTILLKEVVFTRSCQHMAFMIK